MTRYDCKTANGVDDCLRQTAAARAAAEATADATAAGPVRTTWDDDSDAAWVAATEAAEQVERARQARRRPMRVSRLAQVAKILVPELDIIALDKFLRLSRAARDCAMEEHERRNPRRSFAVLPLVLGWCSRDMAMGDGMDGDSETEEGACTDSATKYAACPAVALRYDRASGEFVPAAGDADAEFTWSATYAMAGEYHEENELRNDSDSVGAYAGQRLRVYWRPAPEDGVELPPRRDRYQSPLPSRGVRDAWIDFGPGGSGVQSHQGLRYNVLEDVDDELRDEDDEWNGTRTVSGRVRVEGFRATRKQLVRLARAAQIETREKRKLHEEIDARMRAEMNPSQAEIGAWNQGG